MDNMDLIVRIISARNKDEEIVRNKELEQQKRLETCISKLCELTPKIKKLIDVANTLVENGYCDFVKNHCSNGISHLVGLMIDFSKNKVDSIGICNGGYYGDYDFHTTGKKTYMTEHNKSTPVSKEIKINNAEATLEEFDDFEKRFYNRLEIFLQKKGV